MCLIIIILMILAFVVWVSSVTLYLVIGIILALWMLIYYIVHEVTDKILNKKYMSDSRHKKDDSDVD